LIYPESSSALQVHVQSLTCFSHNGSMFEQRLVAKTLCTRAEHIQAVMMRRGQISHDCSCPTLAKAAAWWDRHSRMRKFSPAPPHAL